MIEPHEFASGGMGDEFEPDACAYCGQHRDEGVHDVRPQSYDCTLCGKVHRLSAQSRGYGTDRYSLHYTWRVGGSRDTGERPAGWKAGAR